MTNKPVSCFEAEKVMEKALDIGEAMLRSGGEILRVEDTIMRICLAYGDGIVDVFTILSLIIVSWHTTDDKNYTQTRRIYSYTTDLTKLEELNALSRYICANKPDCEEIERRTEHILNPANSNKVSKSEILGYVLGSGGFAVFFGGNIKDGIAAGLIAVFMYFWNRFYRNTNNRMIYLFLTSFVVGVICILSCILHIGVNPDKVMIGTIMLLIPGINMMISIRDTICNDLITGFLRLAGSLIEAVAIAVGYGLAIVLFQNIPL